jgi:uncharacterized membrane protein YciS (DUF1049 family)
VLDLESVMIIIVGLIIVIAAVIIGVAGVLGNGGQAHTLAHGFAVFGYHVTGHTGTLFLAGMIVGAAAVLGLSLLLAGARRTSRRGSAARRGLKQSRQETAAVRQDRDDLIGQRDTARAYTASTPGDDGAARNGSDPGLPGPSLAERLFGRRPAHPQAAAQPAPPASQASAPVITAQPEPPVGQAAAVPAAPSASAQ